MRLPRRRLLALGAAAASWLAGPVTAADTSSRDWDTAPSDAHGLPAQALDEALHAGERVAGLRALVVVRDGVLLGERYYGGAGVDDLQPINSVTKSVVSLLVGLVLDRGGLALDAPLKSLLPEAFAEVPESVFADVTLAQLLAGRTGIGFDLFRGGRELGSAADPVRHTLELPRAPAAPSGWSYNDAAVGLLAPLLERVEGRDLAALAERDLFGPLGITRHAWRRDRRGRPTAYGGLVLRPRDLARIAWLATDGGRWRGRQVVPSAWIARATTPHGPADWRVPPIADIGYGDLWFTGTLDSRRVAWGWGYGGQFALAVPGLRLAIATAATSPPSAQLRAQTDAVMAVVAAIVRAAS
jgi:CubicO group peptidase (beta-lactamase class C family)